MTADPRAAGDDPVDDETVVSGALDTGDETIAADDLTRWVPRPGSDDLTASDATVVSSSHNDATVVSMSHDATVVSSPRSASGQTDESGSLGRSESLHSVSPARPGATFADYMRGAAAGKDAGGSGLDPERRIAEVPGRMPWDAGPVAETGVHQGLPVVYGPRERADGAPGGPLDRIHLEIGPAPAAVDVQVKSGRSTLPSLARRERRARIATLVGYVAVAVVAALGLWGVAMLAFG